MITKRPYETDQEFEARKKRVSAVHRSSNFNLVRVGGGGVVAEAVPLLGFETVLFTGTAATQIINTAEITNGVDFVWTKRRDATANHLLYDSIRGVGKYLQPNTTAAEATLSTTLEAFGDSSFTIGSGDNANALNADGVAWCASLPTDDPTNTDGRLTASIKTNGWMSAIAYTGDGVASPSIGHKLDDVPELTMVKSRTSGTEIWAVSYISGGVDTAALVLNDSNAHSAGNSAISGTVTSTVIPLVNGGHTNANTHNYIVYAFTSKAGVCKIGTFTNSASVSGVGFQPSYIIAKRTDLAGDWITVDSQRSNFLEPNTTDTEALNGANPITFTADGFTTSLSTGTYIYIAIA